MLTPGVPSGIATYANMTTLPGKKPLIQLADRPPNYEAPLEYFRTPITPNEQFFVRYHLSDIPEVNVASYKIKVDGDGANSSIELTFDDLKKMPAVEIAAVNQCSGNRRGLSTPHVPGVEWGYGAMGCARWKGPRLKDVLDKVGIKKECIEIALDGADGPVVDKTPDFIKSIPLWRAMDEIHHRSLRDERTAASAFERLPRAARRPRLDRHLLDETSHPYRSTDNAAGRLLDETRLSSSGWQVSHPRSLHHAGRCSIDANYRDGRQLVDYQPS